MLYRAIKLVSMPQQEKRIKEDEGKGRRGDSPVVRTTAELWLPGLSFSPSFLQQRHLQAPQGEMAAA